MSIFLRFIIRLHMRLFISLFALSISLNCLAASEAPSFPVSGEISQLSIRSNSSISEPIKIDEFLRELGKFKSGWERPIGTFPTARTTVGLIDSSGRLRCVVWVGPNWLGSKCGLLETSHPLLVPLTTTQARYFRDFVDGKWEIK